MKRKLNDEERKVGAPPTKKLKKSVYQNPIPKKKKSVVLKKVEKHQYPTKRKKKKRKLKGRKQESVAEQFFYKIEDQEKGYYNSAIHTVSKFNNWIKSVLISRFVKEGDDVLDLGCGRGGDFAKYHSANINSWTGCDISLESVNQARIRYNKKNNFTFDASFVAVDLTKTNLYKNTEKIRKSFDVISIQFALHYFFKSEKTIRNLLVNVNENLRKGGYFIVTTTDGYVVKKKLEKEVKDNNSLIINNGMYKFEFEKSKFPKKDGPYGIKTIFSLSGAVHECPEYVVHPIYFKKICEEYELEIVEDMNFHDFIQKYKDIKEYREIFQKYYSVHKITKQDWDSVYIYRTYVMRRRGGKENEKYFSEKKRYKDHHIFSENDVVNLLEK